MAVRSEPRANVAGSIEDVYRYVSDVHRWPEWATAIRECRVGGDGQLAAGARLEQRVKGMFGSTRDRTLAVSAADPPSQLAFAGKMGPSPLRWGFDLVPIDVARTDIALWVEVERRSIMCAIPEGLLASMIRRVNNRELVAIKVAVESTPATSRPAAER
jgi:hypothetical protein